MFLMFLESFSSVTLSDDIINESGVCQNCFIKFNEYDEHLTKAEQIQNELIGLMDNKLYGLEEVQESIIKQEELDIEDAEEIDTENSIEYAPYETETEEIFVTNNEGYLATESNPKNFYFGISNEDVKENKKLTGETLVKSRATRKTLEYPVVLMDNQKMYQCDICSRAFKEKSKLRTHREIHTTERNVFCPVSIVFRSDKLYLTFKLVRNVGNHLRLKLVYGHTKESTILFTCFVIIAVRSLMTSLKFDKF